ncbi:hypothetical protein E1211_23460 [Micromonospora sp. 15K316]|uniref:hypothetical protein n=1 Tax=Micromonospora sp. 15K316 TaxID=2530376 RepID=UPI00104B81A7|nr:hypothetical protein [Micromonospora sp. 15K316]TDC30875.1 hypothetical protein E1211_23460 [Micromonospora sp. 15K316]
MNTERIAEAIQRQVLAPGETIENLSILPDAVFVSTSAALYSTRPADWAVAEEKWVAEVVRVVASRQPIFTTHSLLFPTESEPLYLNRPETMAELGRRVGAGLNPVAYAELFGELYSTWEIGGPVVHPFGATRTARAGWLVRETDHFARVIVVPDAPPVAPPVFEQEASGEWTLTFFSHNFYSLEVRTAVDVYAWTVSGGPARAATWERKTIAERVLRPLPLS